jgi:hypothetical protein
MPSGKPHHDHGREQSDHGEGGSPAHLVGRTPANTGPTIEPSPATVTTAANARSRAPGAAESPSHDRPADQIVPDPTPKSARAASRAGYPGAAATPAIDTPTIAPAASVTRRAPNRSLSRPAGTEAITIARLAAESSAPACTDERW